MDSYLCLLVPSASPSPSLSVWEIAQMCTPLCLSGAVFPRLTLGPCTDLSVFFFHALYNRMEAQSKRRFICARNRSYCLQVQPHQKLTRA